MPPSAAIIRTAGRGIRRFAAGLALLALSAAAAERLPEPGRCGWEYRLALPPNGPTSSRWPLPGVGGDGLTLFVGQNAPQVSDLLVTDAATNRARAPFLYLGDSTLRVDPPLAVAGGDGRPLLLTVLESRLAPNRLLVWRPEADSTAGFDHPWRELPASGPASAAREFFAGEDPPSWSDRHTNLLAAGDFRPEHAGVELLVEHHWSCRDFSEIRHWLELRTVEDWRLHWRVEIPAAVEACVVQGEGAGVRFLLLTGNGCHGREALGADDCRPWLLRLGADGRPVGEAVCAAPEGARGVTVQLFAPPSAPDRVLLLSTPDWTPDPRYSTLRLLDAGSLAAVAEARVPTHGEALLLAAAAGGEWRLLLAEDGNAVSAWSPALEAVARLEIGEGFDWLGWLPSPAAGPGAPGEPLALLATASGRLATLDGRLRPLAVDALASGAFVRRRVGAEPGGGWRIPVYAAGGDTLAALNTTAGPLHGRWVRRERGLAWLGWLALALGSCVLAHGLWVFYRRWRINRSALRALFRTSPDAVLLADRRLRLVELNGPMARLLADVAERPAETRPRSGESLRVRLGDPRLFRLLEVLEAGRPVQETWTALVDGSPRKWWLELRPLLDGRADRMLTLRDATAQLARDQRKIWNGLAQGTAHRMKQPLQGLAGAADSILHLLHRKAGESLDDAETARVRDRARESAEIVRELDGLIHEFLELSDLEPQPRPFDLRGLLLEHVGAFRKRQGRPGLEIRLRVEDGLPDPAVADPFHLLHALVNLLENAQKAVEGAGEILVRAGALDGGGFWISVADDGCGIAPEALPAIFRPHEGGFAEGTGLGLAIVQLVMDGHGGRVRVASRPGEGTTMRLEFPEPGGTT